MKRAASLLLFLLLPSGFSQVAPPLDTLSQVTAGCPVILKAAFVRPGRLVLIAGESQSIPSLHLQLNNPTSKPIKSVDVTVRVLYKPNPYQLDASKKDVSFTLSNPFTDEALPKEWSPASIKLSQNVLGFQSVVLHHIDYQDGSVWDSVDEDRSNRCAYGSVGVNSVIAQ